MAWTVEYSDTALKQLRRLDRQQARRILDFMTTRVAEHESPRSLGQALSGSLRTYWRYRVGDYRVICDLDDEVLRILVVELGHRREVYR